MIKSILQFTSEAFAVSQKCIESSMHHWGNCLRRRCMLPKTKNNIDALRANREAKVFDRKVRLFITIGGFPNLPKQAILFI